MSTEQKTIRPLYKCLSILLFAAFVIQACATPATPITPHPNLTTDRLGTSDDLKPSQAEIDSAKSVLGDNGLIGFISCTLGSEYYSTVANSALQRAKEFGIKVEIFDSEAKAEKQISAIEDFVAKGARVIILCVVDPKVIEAAVKEAVEAGVFIVQYAGRDSAVNGIGISIEDADLGCAAGEIAGDLIVNKMGGQAAVAILDYPDLPNVVVRADNIEKCLKEKAPNAAIVGRFLGGIPENGLQSMESALQAHPDIDVVVSINDAGAYGALNALKAAGKDPADTFIVGIDAEAQARDLIKQGKFYYGTVDTSPAVTGIMVVDAAIKILASATVPKNISVPVTKIAR